MATHGRGHNFQGINVQGGRAQLGDIYQIGQENALARLPVAHSALFNSYESSPDEEAECLSGTRSGVLDQIQEWADGPSSASIFWLNGMAGKGKSTVARTIARAYHDKKQLGASYFFSRGANGPNNASFFTTIAVQLASCCPSLRLAITRAAEENHNVANETLRDQWNQLILKPLLSADPEINSSPAPPRLVIVDALDECESRHATEILRLLSEARATTAVKLRILITSRPETAIRCGFRDMAVGVHQSLALDEIPRGVVDKDISEYFRNRFRDTVRVSEGSLSHGWPGEAVIASLVQKAAGLFIYAATVCRFIQRHDTCSPTELLALFVPNKQSDVLQVRKPTLPAESPTAELDVLYMTVLDKSMANNTPTEDEERLSQEFKLDVGALVLLFEPLSLMTLSNLLGEDWGTLYRRLRRLRSVLSVSEDLDHPIQLLHPSFRDFLTTKDRCTDHKYQIDPAVTHQLLTERCLGRLTHRRFGLRKDICNLSHPGTRAESVGAQLVGHFIPSEVQYACVYWAHHLIATGAPVADDSPSHHFLQKHFLHWLEALSLVRRFHDGITPLFSLDSTVLRANSPNMFDFVQDAKRFIRHNRSIMENTPLQVYCGALIYSPENSVVRKHYFLDQAPSWIKRPPAVDRDWDPCLQVLEGHDDSVMVLAFSQDGRTLASVDESGTVMLWDLGTGSLNYTLEGHSACINAVVFSPTNQSFASASDDGIVKLWDPRNGIHHTTLQVAPDSSFTSVDDVCFSPDGKILACASADTITLWDPVTGALHRSLHCPRDKHVTALSFAPEGKLLASGSCDGTVLLWDSATGSIHKSLQHRVSAVVDDVAFSPVDGNVLAIASGNGAVRLWHVNRGHIRELALELYSIRPTAVAFSPDGKQLGVSIDCRLALWNLESGTFKLAVLGNCEGECPAVVAFSPDGKLVASSWGEYHVKLWDAVATFGVSDHLLEHDGHSEQVNAVVVSASGRVIASLSDDQTVKLWDPETGACVATLVAMVGDKRADWAAVAFSADGQNLASLTFDGTIIVWDMATRSVHHTLVPTEYFGHTKGLSWSPNGRLLVALHCSAVCLWDLTTGTRLHALRGPPETIPLNVAFSPDSRLIAAAFERREGVGPVQLGAWNAWTGERILDTVSHHTISGVLEDVRWLYFDPAGTHLWTNLGSVKLPRPLHFETNDSPTAAPADIYVWGNCIMHGDREILRRRIDDDTTASDFRAGILALGHESGRVTVLYLDEKEIPRS